MGSKAWWELEDDEVDTTEAEFDAAWEQEERAERNKQIAREMAEQVEQQQTYERIAIDLRELIAKKVAEDPNMTSERTVTSKDLKMLSSASGVVWPVSLSSTSGAGSITFDFNPVGVKDIEIAALKTQVEHLKEQLKIARES